MKFEICNIIIQCEDDRRPSILTIYAPMIYTAPCVMFLMRADALRGEVGPSEIASAILGPLPHVMHLPASKTLRTGPYKSLVHRWFYEHENCIAGSVADP
jgi:hypothetical protein